MDKEKLSKLKQAFEVHKQYDNRGFFVEQELLSELIEIAEKAEYYEEKVHTINNPLIKNKFN
jgi:hypothetical protein